MQKRIAARLRQIHADRQDPATRIFADDSPERTAAAPCDIFAGNGDGELHAVGVARRRRWQPPVPEPLRQADLDCRWGHAERSFRLCAELLFRWMNHVRPTESPGAVSGVCRFPQGQPDSLTWRPL